MKSVIYSALVVSVVNAGLEKMVANGDECTSESMCADVKSCCGSAIDFGGISKIMCAGATETSYYDTVEDMEYTGFACLPEGALKTAASAIATLAMGAYMLV